MTRYIKRFAKSVGMEPYLLEMKIISVQIPQTSTLFPKDGEKSLMGVYFKVTRGNHRLNGQNRYAIYGSADETTQINETFEQRSNFYVNQADKMYQEKQLVIKFKQESNLTKDLVLAHTKFDIARFVGKENVIYEVSMDSNT